MPVGVRARSPRWKWAAILFAVVFGAGGAFFGPAIIGDVTSRAGAFPATRRKLERLRNIALLRSAEQKRLMKTLDGEPHQIPNGRKITTAPRH
jgi:hypothetical protein